MCAYTKLEGCAGKEVRAVKRTQGMMNIRKKYGANIICGAELGVNFSALPASQGFDTWFEDDREIQSVEAHNKHDSLKRLHRQQGGVGMICFNEYAQYAKNKSRDPRSLGRWCSYHMGILRKSLSQVSHSGSLQLLQG